MPQNMNEREPTIVTLAATLVQLRNLDTSSVPHPPATIWMLPTVDCYLTIDASKADGDARGTNEILLKADTWFPYEPEAAELGTASGVDSDSSVFVAGPTAGSVYCLPRYRRLGRD